MNIITFRGRKRWFFFLFLFSSGEFPPCRKKIDMEFKRWTDASVVKIGQINPRKKNVLKSDTNLFFYFISRVWSNIPRADAVRTSFTQYKEKKRRRKKNERPLSQLHSSSTPPFSLRLSLERVKTGLSNHPPFSYIHSTTLLFFPPFRQKKLTSALPCSSRHRQLERS